VYLRFPEDLDIPENVVQQIQISHNFTESYIITEEKTWSSVSTYNPETELIVVLVLDKYDDGNDFIVVLEEFNKELKKEIKEEDLERHLESLFKLSLSVFRARDAVFTKLSNEMAELKMKVFFYERRFNKVLQCEELDERSTILYLLSMNDELSVKDISKLLGINEEAAKSIIDDLDKKDVLAHDPKKDVYYLKFT
jgi:hypothetical protein